MYVLYSRAFGLIASIAFLFSQFIGSGGFDIGSNLWLAAWSDDSMNGTSTSISVEKRLIVYTLFGIAKGE